MDIEKINQIFIYTIIGIFIALVIVMQCDKKSVKNQRKQRKYYSIETKNIFRYLQYFLFLSFFYMIGLMLIFNGEIVTELWIIILLITILFVTLTYFSIRQIIKFKKEKYEILKYGVKVDGIVKEEFIEETFSNNRISRLIYMVVEYMQDGEKKTYITPQVEFGYSELRNTNVDVYIYKDKVFVTNFNFK